MGNRERTTIVMAACVGLAGLNAALAEPPPHKSTAAISQASPRAARETMQPPLHGPLDLRPPSDAWPGGSAAGVAGPRSSFAADLPFRSNDHVSSAPWADAPHGGHIMSPLETMARNFRQEGLPVARLFQSSTSLVHLGLNPKGKPGLWLIHKMH